MEIKYTLVCDGPTDAALIPILNWLLVNAGISVSFEGVWADLRNYSSKARRTLPNKIIASIQLFPCELLFIHRDAERIGYQLRKSEIDRAIEYTQRRTNILPSICVIPVRMTEAWLLFNESAIRRAAGNPNGTMHLDIPRLSDLEKLPDPKNNLIDIITIASGLPQRRINSLSFPNCIRQIPEYINDFSPLRSLPAFGSLERDIKDIITLQSWK
jgi:hypothetical protein